MAVNNWYQWQPPPYSMGCSGVYLLSAVPDPTGDGTKLESKGAAVLLCGVCGEPRCGDEICDLESEDATSCPEDCERDRPPYH